MSEPLNLAAVQAAIRELLSAIRSGAPYGTLQPLAVRLVGMLAPDPGRTGQSLWAAAILDGTKVVLDRLRRRLLHPGPWWLLESPVQAEAVLRDCQVELVKEDEGCIPDGPFSGRRFGWGGRACDILTPNEYCILELLWSDGRKQRCITFENVRDAVGSEARSFKSQICRLDEKLNRERIFLGLSCRNDQVFCEWAEES